jgi:hypothetical protein
VSEARFHFTTDEAAGLLPETLPSEHNRKVVEQESGLLHTIAPLWG